MKTCIACREKIKPATPIVEVVGGLLDPDDPDFFVVDEGVMPTTYVHRECLIKKFKEA